jgi:hypothetical protein
MSLSSGSLSRFASVGLLRDEHGLEMGREPTLAPVLKVRPCRDQLSPVHQEHVGVRLGHLQDVRQRIAAVDRDTRIAVELVQGEGLPFCKRAWIVWHGF